MTEAELLDPLIRAVSLTKLYMNRSFHIGKFHILLNYDLNPNMFDIIEASNIRRANIVYHPFNRKIVCINEMSNMDAIKHDHRVHIFITKSLSCIMNGMLQEYVKMIGERSNRKVIIHIPRIQSMESVADDIYNTLSSLFNWKMVTEDYRTRTTFHYHNWYSDSSISVKYQKNRNMLDAIMVSDITNKPVNISSIDTNYKTFISRFENAPIQDYMSLARLIDACNRSASCFPTVYVSRYNNQ